MKRISILFKYLILLVLCLSSLLSIGQINTPVIKSLNELKGNKSSVNKYWLEMGTNTFGQPIQIPVVLIQGKVKGPTIGLFAAIHGNELNGIPIIHRLMDSIDVKRLKGRIIVIPGLNAISIPMDKRKFIDGTDLNRIFPGKEHGNRSQQYVYKIAKRILPSLDILIDMHTASFGRANSFYVRADLSKDTLSMLAKLQRPDIILDSKGLPSAGAVSKSLRTMRAEATLQGIHAITVEYGNPQVFQKDLTIKGLKGIMNTLNWLKMYENNNHKPLKDEAVYCTKSYWIYTDEGGFLEINVELNQRLNKGDEIATLRDAFGTVIKKYFAPEKGIVIGKSTNPENMNGGRIIHLGVLK